MKIEFTKYDAHGNDFIIIDKRDYSIHLDKFRQIVKQIATRRLGIGADGVIFIEEGENESYRMRYFNADGNEVALCGNGLRSIAHYLFRKHSITDFSIETLSGILPVKIDRETEMVSVNMPQPGDTEMSVKLDNIPYELHFMRVGVEHTVLLVDNLNDIDVVGIGRKIRYHEYFAPDGTNANFVKVVSPNEIDIRTYERGVEDETLACGTGSISAVLICELLGKCKLPVKVNVRYPNSLIVSRDNDGNIQLSGKVKRVYTGIIEL